MTTIDAELDTSGLSCPLPILKAKKALTGLRGGQGAARDRLRPGIDPGFRDLQPTDGPRLAGSAEELGQFYFLLRNPRGLKPGRLEPVAGVRFYSPATVIPLQQQRTAADTAAHIHVSTDRHHTSEQIIQIAGDGDFVDRIANLALLHPKPRTPRANSRRSPD